MISGGDRPFRYPWFRAMPHHDGYLFEYGGQIVKIAGLRAVPLLSELLPLLDGRRTVEEIHRALPDWDRAAITRVLTLLADNGLMAWTGPPEVTNEEEHLLTALGALREGEPVVSRSRLGVVGSGALADEVSGLCRRSGVMHLVPLAWDMGPTEELDLVIAAPDGKDLPHLDRWNHLMLDRRRPWILVLPFDGVFGAVGPLFIPGETACYACLRTRRRSVLSDPELAAAYDERPAYFPMGASLTSVMVGLAVHVGLRWIARRDAWMAGILFAVELSPYPRLSAHEVLPVPRCPACRPMAQHRPSPWPRADISPQESTA